jgi:hypothetical protein
MYCAHFCVRVLLVLRTHLADSLHVSCWFFLTSRAELVDTLHWHALVARMVLRVPILILSLESCAAACLTWPACSLWEQRPAALTPPFLVHTGKSEYSSVFLYSHILARVSACLFLAFFLKKLVCLRFLE